ncbi:ionotropic receptor 25a-like [Limulus polyphemus]|uniref:Ionotropic receptor 25a-like n=1 Tax=Limulus polyphemus TaxID=6850 RepID=A0ABM1TA85_LIMPO|nr:ionotropic receptor 25a-like [Limulus polyphemus]
MQNVAHVILLSTIVHKCIFSSAASSLDEPIFQRIFPIRMSTCDNSLAYSFPENKAFNQTRHVRVVAEEWLPFVKVDVIGACLAVRGPMAEILHLLSTNLNFTIGQKNICNILDWQEAEFLLTPVSANFERLEVADFTRPLMVDPQALLVASPTEENNAFGLFLSLNWEVWLALLISMFSLSFVSWIFDIIKKKQPFEEKTSGVLDNLWHFFICILLQGFERLPSSFSKRFLIGVWLIGCFVTMSAFSGLLVSKLTLRKATNRIDSLEDLLERPQITPVIERGGFFESVIKEKESGVYSQLWDIVSKSSENRKPMREMLTDGMIDKIEARTHAISLQFITLKSRINSRFDYKGHCSLYIAKKTFFPKITVAAMRKDISVVLKQQIKQKVSLAVDHDQLGYWIELMMRNYQRCMASVPSSFRSLRVEDLRGAFFCLFMGLGLAVIVFILETIFALSYLRRKPRCLSNS